MGQAHKIYKRILFLSPSSELGGAERSLVDLIKAIEFLGMTAKVILPRQGPLTKLIQRETRASIKIVPMPLGLLMASSRCSPLSMLFAFMALLQLPLYYYRLCSSARSYKPDCVHSNGVKMHLLCPIVANGVKAKSIIHIREFLPSNTILKGILSLAIKGVDHVWVNSQSVLKTLVHQRPDVKLIPVIVDSLKFHASPLPVGLPYRLGCFSVIEPSKNQAMFLAIVRNLIDAQLPVEGWIVGGEIYDAFGRSGYEEKLKVLSSNMGIRPNIIFTGMIDDVAPVMRDCHFIIHTAQSEAFGRVIIEGMACGRVVIAANSGGPTEIISHNKNGCLAATVEEYTSCIIKLIRDHSLYEQMSVNSIYTVKQLYSFEALCKSVYSCLQGGR